MSASAEFEHVQCIITKDCLNAMHNLTLSSNEWGGQFFPKIEDGRCILSCDVDLIKGTGLKEHPDAKFYKQMASTRKSIAVTPFYEEVFKTSRLCERNESINLFSTRIRCS